MDDVFYFSANKVSLAEIAVLAERRGMETTLRAKGLVIVLGGGPYERTHWAEFSIDEAEPEEAAEFRRAGVCSAFCISHHPVARSALVPLLREVLMAFGGWIGSDEAGFRPRYDLANLDSFARD